MGNQHSLSSDDFSRLKEDGVEVRSFKATLIDTTPGLVAEPLSAAPESHAPPPPPPAEDGDEEDDNGLLSVLGSSGGRAVTITFAGKEVLIRESDGLRGGMRTLLVAGWTQVLKLVWDHAQSAAKVEGRPAYSDWANNGAARDASSSGANVFAIVTVQNSLELEVEVKNRIRAEAKRLSATGACLAMPEFVYIGMFAGSTKPKPFQRKRANLSHTVPAGQLPPLTTMRRWALEAHAGSSRPLPQNTSMRSEMALELVYNGENRFMYLAAEKLPTAGLGLDNPTSEADGGGETANAVAAVRTHRTSSSGGSGGNRRGSSIRSGRGGELVFSFANVTAHGGVGGVVLPMLYQDITEWRIVDNCHENADGNGLVVTLDDPCVTGPEAGPRTTFYHFHKSQIQHVRETMSFFWNRVRAEQCQSPHPGSTHGRAPYSVLSLAGEQKAPEPPLGRAVIVDVDGVTVRPGQLLRSPRHPTLRRTSMGVSSGGAMTPGGTAAARVASLVADKTTLKMNMLVKKHWDAVVVHSGWLQKQGGSSATKWVWRFCVLYSTAQGHFLAYYTDLPDVPLYSDCSSHKERGLLDMAKVAFIRPVSAQKGTPAFAFDIVSLDREWTLCAESPKDMLLWMQVLSRAAESDVAVQPDDETVFRVALAAAGAASSAAAAAAGSVGSGAVYTVAGEALVKVSCMGVAVQHLRGDGTPTPRSANAEGLLADGGIFYPYTDFYKWVLVDLRDGMQGLLLKCFRDETFEEKAEHLLVNPKAADIAAHVEYHIEKFMAYMHLRLETEYNSAESGAESEQQQQQQQEAAAKHQQQPSADLLLLDLEEAEASSPSTLTSTSTAAAAASTSTFAIPPSPAPPGAIGGANRGMWGGGSALDVGPTPKNAPRNPFDHAEKNSSALRSDGEDDDDSTGPPSTEALSPAARPSSTASAAAAGRGNRAFFFAEEPQHDGDSGQQQQQQQQRVGGPAPVAAASLSNGMPAAPPAALGPFPYSPALAPLRWDTLAPVPPSPAAAVFSPGVQTSVFGAIASPSSPLEAPVPLEWLQDPFTNGFAAAPPLQPPPAAAGPPPPAGEQIHSGSVVTVWLVEKRFANGVGEATLHYRPLVAAGRVTVTPSAGSDGVALGWEVPPLQTKAGGLQHTVKIQCRRPFADVPELLACVENITGGQKREERVKLPFFGLCAFMEPLRVAAPAFQQRWQALAAAPDRTAQAVFRPSAAVVTLASAGPVKHIAAALHLEEVSGSAGAAAAPSAAALAGILRTTTVGANGETVSVGCLVIVERDQGSGALRVTARSANAVVAAAVAAAAQQCMCPAFA